MDLDLRLVRSFVAVARHGHFGRAANERHLTQPALSRQVSRLEEALGVTLLRRTSRRVELTEAGREFFDEAEAILHAADRAVRDVRRRARPAQVVEVGFMGGIRTDEAVAAFRAQHPGLDVHLTHLEWWDQAESLRDGRVDVAFVRLPIDVTDLRLRTIGHEPRAVLVSHRHPLAAAAEASIMDLLDEPVVGHHFSFADWDAFWTVDPRPDGSRPKRGVTVRTVEEKLEAVASGGAIAFMPLSAAVSYVHPAVRYLPLTDVAPSTTALAWRAARRWPPLRHFVQAVCPKGRSGSTVAS